MTWFYLPETDSRSAPAEVGLTWVLGLQSQISEPFATSKSRSTRANASLRGSAQDTCTPPRYGMTSRRSTPAHGEASTPCWRDTHASSPALSFAPSEGTFRLKRLPLAISFSRIEGGGNPSPRAWVSLVRKFGRSRPKAFPELSAPTNIPSILTAETGLPHETLNGATGLIAVVLPAT